MVPSASAAWRMSSLPAIKNIEAINDLKLRFSYGVTGRSGFPKYSALARYEQGGYWLDDNGQWTQAWGPTNNLILIYIGKSRYLITWCGFFSFKE